jgi:hypothetical protein
MQSKISIPTIRVLLAAALLALGLSGPAWGQARPKLLELAGAEPAAALFVGNSYFYFNNGLDSYVRLLAASAEPKQNLRTVMATISDGDLSWYDLEAYYRANETSAFSVDAANKPVTGKPNLPFDVTVIADCSFCPVNAQTKAAFFDYAKQRVETIRKHGARPVLFMTWAYGDAPEMTAALAEAYTKAGNENNALVIPAGLAFARSIAQRPDVNLYFFDKQHPSRLGTYLAACTAYASLFHKSPVGVKWYAGIDEPTATFLQTIAWETTQGYFQK